MILEQMDTYRQHQGRGYAQACLAYFLEKVVLEKHIVAWSSRTQAPMQQSTIYQNTALCHKKYQILCPLAP